jgi:hypothetical protein
VWLKKQARDKVTYQINLENPVLKRILGEIDVSRKWIKKLFHVIENSVPHRLIIMDNRENEDCHVDLPENIAPPPPELIEICQEFYRGKIAQGRTHEEAVDIVCSIEPFDSHPLYRACLDKIEENQGK